MRVACAVADWSPAEKLEWCMKRLTAWFVCLALVASSFGAPVTASSEELDSDSGSEAFLYPQSDDVAYEPRVVLVRLREGVTAEQVKDAIAGYGYESAVSEATTGVLRIEFASSWEAEEASNKLLERKLALSAQPNYAYALIEDGATDGLTENVEDNGSGIVPTEQTVEEPETRLGVERRDSGDDGNASNPVELEAGDAATWPETDGEGQHVEAQATVDDPMSRDQWGLTSANVYAAWDLVRGNHRVTVAVLDQGFDVNHEDLKENVVNPYNSVSKTSDVSPISGSTTNKNHGTHVAGIIAGVAHNGIGIAGVSYNANVMPVKVTHENGSAYTDDLLAAYDYVIAKKTSRNVRVINLSMGNASKVSTDDEFVQKIAEAYNKGIVTVAAAGNKGKSNTGNVPYTIYPADYPPIVSVINLSKTSEGGVERYTTSNYNFSNERTKDIAAPGTDMLSTVPGNDYASMTGTSMAAPLVSGVLALEFAANPSLTATAAVERLYASTTRLTARAFDTEYGWGEVNAYEAVRAAKYGADATRLAEVRKEMAAQGIPSQVFNDVSTSTAHYEDIYWAAENGISTGWETSSGREFRPLSYVARADMAAFLYRVACKWDLVSDSWQPTTTQRNAFYDVSASTPHAREIWWLASMGVSEGWSTGRGREFRPYAGVARADMAAFLHRLAVAAGITTTGTAPTFVDVTASMAHAEDIRWVAGVGISSGWYGTRGREYRPYAITARADMAAFLHRLYNLR